MDKSNPDLNQKAKELDDRPDYEEKYNASISGLSGETDNLSDYRHLPSQPSIRIANSFTRNNMTMTQMSTRGTFQDKYTQLFNEKLISKSGVPIKWRINNFDIEDKIAQNEEFNKKEDLELLTECLEMFFFVSCTIKESLSIFINHLKKSNGTSGQNLKSKQFINVFMSLFEFSDLNLLQALRIFFQHIYVAGETQDVDMILMQFANKYVSDIKMKEFAGDFHTASFAIVLMNTALANKETVPNQEKFVESITDACEKVILSDEEISNIFDSITKKKIEPPIFQNFTTESKSLEKYHNLLSNEQLMKVNCMIYRQKHLTSIDIDEAFTNDILQQEYLPGIPVDLVIYPAYIVGFTSGLDNDSSLNYGDKDFTNRETMRINLCNSFTKVIGLSPKGKKDKRKSKGQSDWGKIFSKKITSSELADSEQGDKTAAKLSQKSFSSFELVIFQTTPKCKVYRLRFRQKVDRDLLENLSNLLNFQTALITRFHNKEQLEAIKSIEDVPIRTCYTISDLSTNSKTARAIKLKTLEALIDRLMTILEKQMQEKDQEIAKQKLSKKLNVSPSSNREETSRKSAYQYLPSKQPMSGLSHKFIGKAGKALDNLKNSMVNNKNAEAQRVKRVEAYIGFELQRFSLFIDLLKRNESF